MVIVSRQKFFQRSFNESMKVSSSNIINFSRISKKYFCNCRMHRDSYGNSGFRAQTMHKRARYAEDNDICLKAARGGTGIVKEFFKHALPRGVCCYPQHILKKGEHVWECKYKQL